MEIIAKRYPRLRAFIVILVASVMLIAIGAVLIALGAFIVNYPDALDIIGFVLILIGIACTVMMIISIVRFCRLPENLIMYENGELKFHNGFTCRPAEVTGLDCKKADPAYKNVKYDFGFGLITVFVGDKKIKVYYVAQPSDVYTRLKNLVAEAKLLGD